MTKKKGKNNLMMQLPRNLGSLFPWISFPFVVNIIRWVKRGENKRKEKHKKRDNNVLNGVFSVSLSFFFFSYILCASIGCKVCQFYEPRVVHSWRTLFAADTILYEMLCQSVCQSVKAWPATEVNLLWINIQNWANAAVQMVKSEVQTMRIMSCQV